MFPILVMVAKDMIVELPDILFDSVGEDKNLIFDGQDHHYPIKAHLVIWVSG